MRTTTGALGDEDKREQVLIDDPLVSLARKLAELNAKGVQEVCTPGHRSGRSYSLLLSYLRKAT